MTGGHEGTRGCLGGSRASLANTSLTSAPDLSTLSSLTLARRNDLDQASLVSGKMSPVAGEGSGRSLVSPDSSTRSPRSPSTEGGGVRESASTPGTKRKDDASKQNISAASQPHLMAALSPKKHQHKGSLGGEQKPLGDNIKNRRSVQSDDGYYEQSDSFVTQNGVNDSDTDEDEGPNKLRPSKLSVSQTTLIRDPDLMVSEPATPRAGETPDTVRLYVPYGQDEDSITITSENEGGYTTFANQFVANGVDIHEMTSKSNKRDVLPDELKIIKGKEGKSIHRESNVRNGVESPGDKHKIKIRVDGDEALSSLSSAGDSSLPNSPREAFFNSTDVRISKNITSPRKKIDSVFGEETDSQEIEHDQPTAPTSQFEKDETDSTRITHFESKLISEEKEENTDLASKKFSEEKILTPPDEQVKNGSSSRQALPTYQFSTPLIGAQKSPKKSNDLPSSPLKNLPTYEFSTQMTSLSPVKTNPHQIFGEGSQQKNEANSSSSAQLSPVLRKKSTKSSPVQVTISSYYESKHHVKTVANDSKKRTAAHFDFDSDKIQHFYHNRQSSPATSPPPPTQARVPPPHFSSPPSSRHPPSSSAPHRSSPHKASFQKGHHRHASEHSTLHSTGLPPSASFTRMARDKVAQDSIHSSTGALQSKKVIASYSANPINSSIIDSANPINSSIIDRSPYNTKQQDLSHFPKYRLFQAAHDLENSEFQATSQRGKPQEYKHFTADEPLRESSFRKPVPPPTFPKPRRDKFL